MTEQEKMLAGALGRVVSGVYVLTARHEGRESGMLASWVQQCSFRPPMLSLAVQRARAFAGLLVSGSAFALNILESSQTEMIAHFGKGFALADDAFQGLDVTRSETDALILNDALAVLQGVIRSFHTAGDHDIYLGEVLSGKMLQDGQPMVHIRKNGFHY